MKLPILAFVVLAGVMLICSTLMLSRASCKRMGMGGVRGGSQAVVEQPTMTVQRRARKYGFEVFNGVLPHGDDIGGERFLTLTEAVVACGGMPTCKGFTFMGNVTEKNRVRIFFKSAYRPVPTPGWTSFEVYPDIPGYRRFKDFLPSIQAEYNLGHVISNNLDVLQESFPEYPSGEAEDSWFKYVQPSKERVMVSYAPRAFLLPDFIDDEIAKDIRDHGERALQRSQIANSPKANATSSSISNVRTSYGSWLTDEIESVRTLRDRIEKLTGVKRSLFESLQILRYQKDQKYVPHVDYFHPKAYGPQSFNRMATVITYLSNTNKGGQTVFPLAHGFTPNTSDSCSGGLQLNPVQNTAMLFYSMMPDGNFDPWALHGSCPVLGETDEKWVAVQWLRVEYPESGLPPQSR